MKPSQLAYQALVLLLLCGNIAQADEATPPLIKAVTSLQSDQVEALLNEGADPNIRGLNGATALMFVGINTDVDEQYKLQIAKLLVEHGADVNAQNAYGQTVLSDLALRNLPRVMSYIIDKGAKVDTPDQRGQTPLGDAAEAGNLDAARLLVSAGADPLAKPLNNGFWSAYELAVHYKHPDIAELMLSSDKMQKAPTKAIFSAIFVDTSERLQTFINLGGDVNAVNDKGLTPLLFAINNKRNDLVPLLLKAGAKTDPQKQNSSGTQPEETALCLASRQGQTDIVNMLITAKANLDAMCAPVVLAARANNTKTALALINAGANVADFSKSNWRALFEAAKSNNPEIVTSLLAHGTPVDIRQDAEDCTALMIAAREGSLDAIRVLVKNGAHLEAQNEKRAINDYGDNFIGTPLAWALHHKQNAAARLLIELGAKASLLSKLKARLP